MLSGFRLIAPRDPDTGRYLDDVVRVTYGQVRLPVGLLPERKKGMKCESRDLVCVEDNRARDAVWEGLERVTIRNWPRVFHGRGFMGQETVSGHLLRDFLVRNFGEVSPQDYFMLASCDGYRVLCSAREIFLTDSGRGVLIVDEMTGRRPPGWRMLAWTADYYADRESWGISHILRFRMPWDDPQSPVLVGEGL
jgi:hypothetical protein